MKCSVCPKSLTEKQVKRYNRLYGKRSVLKPKPTCSQSCAEVARRCPPKHERKEAWAKRESGWEGRPWGRP